MKKLLLFTAMAIFAFITAQSQGNLEWAQKLVLILLQ